jgi:hypothetical protein
MLGSPRMKMGRVQGLVMKKKELAVMRMLVEAVKARSQSQMIK